MTSVVLVQDVLDSAAKYGNDRVLVWDPAVFRDNKKNKKTFDCTWVPYKFKFADGKEARCLLKYFKVISSSGAKLPENKDGDVKNMLVAFRKVTYDEIAIGDLTPKKKDTDEEQKIEDEKMRVTIEEIVKSTNDFNDAMEIISNSFQKMCSEMKNAKSLGFSIRKDKKVKTNKDVHVYSIRQTHREDKDSEDPDAEPIKLESPLTRLKLMLDKNGKVAIESWDKSSNAFISRPNVYDSRKINKKGNTQSVLATVKVNGKSCPLDSTNAGTFITYRSIFGGMLDFPEIVISKFGFSQKNLFLDTYVKRNKSNLSESMFSDKDLEEFAGSEEDDEDEVEMVVDDLAPKLEKTKIGVNTEVSDIEDANSDGSDLEDGAEASDSE